ncbi:GDSL-like Lipase/Acylhydrolase [Pustulibacterium marinum]|uniref:GDSL-like Lipase/Acylhydrolase n=1 Tax=Pustulibacterium marinum TaxID=1224947 RepID=A0A1I7GQY6_9FLAO|nr:G-D-S-L family lipolytic protein [Pustulibacterium marinum]SFU50864.1 GDSL-like Lipase/Acylhydrolase [Pustulibacterium marinum]
MKYKFTFAFLLSLGLAVSCSDDDVVTTTVEPEVEYTSGSADFSTYVALGNSLTAGYADAALSIQGQEDSYPNLVAQRFQLAGGGDFSQPLMSDNLGGATFSGVQILDNRLILSFATGSPLPVNISGSPSTEITSTLSGAFNNMGVPGSKVFHLGVEGYGNVAGVPTGMANPYFARFASSASASVIGDAMAQSPTFFSLWIGNNDILSYAISGGVGVDQTGNYDPSTYGSNDITDPAVFASVYNGLLQTLTSGGAKGVVANVPDITTIPYFTTVPYNPVPLDATTAAQLNYGFTSYNQGLQLMFSYGLISEEEVAQRTITFSEGSSNALLIVDEDLTDLSSYGIPNYRQTTSEDLVVFTAQTIIGTTVNNDATMVNGVSVPLADQWVLTPQEQTAVATAQASFNATIEGLAAQYGLAFVDAEEVLQQLANGGISVNGSVMTNTYATGGAFSLDGIHPSARGYAYLSNVFIEEINTTYGSNLPSINPLDYTALYLE